jgi:Putative zinc- or iron-chelating domain
MGSGRRRSGRPGVKVPAALQTAWNRVPSANCQGHCYQCCHGPVGASVIEVALLRDRTGKRLPTPLDRAEWARAIDDPEYRCPLLDDANRCQGYEVRPAVCRLWGSVDAMPCPWGCEPDGGRLSRMEGHEILAEALVAGGGAVGSTLARAKATLARVRAHIANPNWDDYRRLTAVDTVVELQARSVARRTEASRGEV